MQTMLGCTPTDFITSISRLNSLTSSRLGHSAKQIRHRNYIWRLVALNSTQTNCALSLCLTLQHLHGHLCVRSDRVQQYPFPDSPEGSLPHHVQQSDLIDVDFHFIVNWCYQFAGKCGRVQDFLDVLHLDFETGAGINRCLLFQFLW